MHPEQQNAPDFYTPPPGITWDMIATHRTEWQLDPRHYPVASVPGVCTAWAIPLPPREG